MAYIQFTGVIMGKVVMEIICLAFSILFSSSHFAVRKCSYLDG
jgi:hypothetical protein